MSKLLKTIEQMQTVRLNPAEVFGGLVNRAFIELSTGNELAFGIPEPDLVVTPYDRTIDGVDIYKQALTAQEAGLVAAIRMAFTTGHITDALLLASVTTSLNSANITGIEMSHIVEIRHFMINRGLINRKATEIPYLDRHTQVVKHSKVWTLAGKWAEKRNQTWDRATEESFKPSYCSLDTIMQLEAGDYLPEIKGESTCWTSTARLKLEFVAYQIDPIWKRKAMAEVNNSRLAPRKADESDYQFDQRVAKHKDKQRQLEALFQAPTGVDIHFPVTCDFRGRMYYRGGLLSPANGKFQRAALQLAKTEMLTASGWAELTIAFGAAKPGPERDALEMAIRRGATEPVGVIIRLDGCCNGVQHMAAICKDLNAAKYTNLVENEIGQPLDLYQHVANKLNVDRDVAKAIVMPYAYGASAGSIANTTGMPVWEVKKALATIDAEFYCISAFTNWVKMSAENQEPDAFRWTVEGFSVVHSYEAMDTLYAGTLAVTRKSGEMDSAKLVNALPPNIIHSLDAAHLRRVVERCNFDVSTIHDSFGCHPNHVAELRKIIIEEFQALHAINPIDSIATDLGFYEPGFQGDLTIDMITNQNAFK